MTRSARIGIGLVALLGAFVFFLLTVGSLGEPQPDLARRSVASVLEMSNPADRFGDQELLIHGFYAELAAECREPSAAAPAGPLAWLERTCPLRVLMPYQPAETVTQEELEAYGLRLAAPNGQPFPARARPDGPNLRLQELVYTGHFDDPAAAQCALEGVDLCRNTFVVSDYDGYLR
ncbi:MAG TPA: hypothetical protein VK838_01870 [Candidatus Limnocylindrales bacterium]|nr:hypothetical protein [Candidatus Limnocylindrales bacterium]